MKENKIDKKKIEKEFIKNFVIPENFYDFKELSVDLGFIIKRKFNPKEQYISSIRINIEDFKTEKIPLKLEAYYSDKKGMPKFSKKFNKPINIESSDEYFYNHKEKEFYRKNKKVSSRKIIKEFYESHIKTTKKFKGFRLRSKLFFWRKFLPQIFKFVDKASKFLFWLASGGKYKYTLSLFEEKEELNEVIIKGSYFGKEIKPNEINKKEEIKDAINYIDFYGHKVSRHTMFFYSVLHFIGYFIFVIKPEFRPNWLVCIFKNVFLTINYAIVSLGLIDVKLPMVMKFLIRGSAKSLFYVQSKKIKI